MKELIKKTKHVQIFLDLVLSVMIDQTTSVTAVYQRLEVLGFDIDASEGKKVWLQFGDQIFHKVFVLET